jgi:hypothetical protein
MSSLNKKPLELLVSLAADLFDLEVAPWPASLFGRIGDNGRYRFTGHDWFFRRIAFDIGAIETVEIRLWMQRRICVHMNINNPGQSVVKSRLTGMEFQPAFNLVLGITI